MREKKEAYQKMLQNKSEKNVLEYKRRCAIAKREIRPTHRESWEVYISQIEDDAHG
jgi:hypothetical protein